MRQAFVLGPVFNSDSSSTQIADAIRGHEMSYSARQAITEALRAVPVISSVTFFHLCLMLHCVVTGEKLSRSDLCFQQSPEEYKGRPAAVQHNRQRTWQAERVLLQMVRDGDTNYESAMERAGQLSNGVRVNASDPVLHAIVSATTFTGLCTRAAIEGGLAPDTAYTLGDSYVQRLLESKTISDVRSINHAMYEDFILRVRRQRLNPDISPQIQSCIDYIETHLEEELQVSDVADHFGYTRHYFSRRFKQETGSNLSDYIKYARIERAKKLLAGTDMSIHDIAESLRFCSSSHFSDTFRSIVGELPLAYRKRNSGK